jgi:hypothetical protein
MKVKGLMYLVAAAAAGTTVAHAQTTCSRNVGPDVIVGDITGPQNYTAAGGLDAFALGTYSCNPGNVWVNWISSTNQHPVVAMNLFKFKSSSFSGAGTNAYFRFEQLGQSWLKNTFFALSNTLCCSGCVSTDGTHLGVSCSDPYTASRNGSQSGMEPKWQVNAHTGAFTYPPANPSFTNNGRRIQVALTDLEASNGTTVRYFGDCQYVSPDDAAAGNQNDNTSYHECGLTTTGTFPNATDSNLTLVGSTVREHLAVEAWKTIDATVTQTEVGMPETSGGPTGRVVLCSKATDLGNGTWHYEYAMYNQNSDVCVGGFSVPCPANATVTNIDFHGVAYRDGDGIGNVNVDGTPWPGTFSGGAVSWSTVPFATNANGNSLRWGSMYNFRFDCNVAPASPNMNTTLTAWKTGVQVAALAQTPGNLNTPCYVNCDSSTSAPCLNVLDFSCFLNAFAAGQSYANCDNSTTPPVLNVLDFSCFLNLFAAGCSNC